MLQTTIQKTLVMRWFSGYKNSRLKTHYVLASKPGIASMRNVILEESLKLEANYLAFIDDDEVVNQDWLEQLLLTAHKFNADIVSGATERILPDTIPNWMREGHFFTKNNSTKTGDIRPTSSTCNVLFDLKKVCINYNLRFDERLSFIGSSDLLFFNQAHLLGAKIVKCNEAIVKEEIPSSRANEEWLLQRSYRRGNTQVARSFIQNGKIKTFIKQTYLAIREWFMYIIRLIGIYKYSSNNKIHSVKTKRPLKGCTRNLERFIWQKKYMKNIENSNMDIRKVLFSFHPLL